MNLQGMEEQGKDGERGAVGSLLVRALRVQYCPNI